MKNQFVFEVTEHPGYYHLATVSDNTVSVLWDKDYIRDTGPLAWTDAHKDTVEAWIKQGGWSVVGPKKPEQRGDYTRLKMGFDALEESFQSLRAEFERLRMQ